MDKIPVLEGSYHIKWNSAIFKNAHPLGKMYDKQIFDSKV